MNGAFEVGGVSLRAQQRALEVMANNIANANTPAFKRSDVSFSEVVGDQEAAVTQAAEDAASLSGGGVRVAVMGSVDSQGDLRRTGQPMDLAIDGQGLLELAGPNGQSLLWRGGRLSINRDGYLASAQGIPLMAMIQVPEDAEQIEISREGTVSSSSGGGEQVVIGQLQLVKVEGDEMIEHLDDGLYGLRPDARVVDLEPGEPGTGVLEQGSIEQSNVDFSQSMVELLMIQRAYAASAQIVQAADQIAAITNNLKR